MWPFGIGNGKYPGGQSVGNVLGAGRYNTLESPHSKDSHVMTIESSFSICRMERNPIHDMYVPVYSPTRMGYPLNKPPILDDQQHCPDVFDVDPQFSTTNGIVLIPRDVMRWHESLDVNFQIVSGRRELTPGVPAYLAGLPPLFSSSCCRSSIPETGWYMRAGEQ